jgi:hypothetical protein
MDIDNVFSVGELFVEVVLEINKDPIMMMMAGYVHTARNMSWPTVDQQEMIPNHAWTYTSFGANPAAGAECLITVPTGELWNVKSVYLNLVTDATVSNRRVRLVLTIDGVEYDYCISPGDQAASANYKYYYTERTGNPSATSADRLCGTLPRDLWMNANDTITTATINLQAGDNYGTPVATYRQYLLD